MEFRVLGPVEVLEADRRKSVGGPKQRTVLALIIANAGQVISTDRIIEGTWGEEPPAGARKSLHTYISNLRGELGDVIGRQGDGYVLTVEREAVDWARFEDLTAAGVELLGEDPEEAARTLRQALELWRGHPYADVDGRGEFEPEITRLNELRLSGLQARIEADLSLGRHLEVIGELEALTKEYPLQEGFRAQQMLALYRAGRQAEALRALERTRSYLVEELGIDPSTELSKLEQQILDHDPALELEVGPTIQRLAVLVVDVGDPSELTRLDTVGRDRLVSRTNEVVEAAAGETGGTLFAQRGTAFFVSVDDVTSSIAVAEAVLRSGFDRAATPSIAIDIGDVESDSTGELRGPPLARAASLVAAAHPGQVLLSAEAHQGLATGEQAGWQLKALGAYRLIGFDRAESVYQLVVGGRTLEYPPLRIDVIPPRLPGVGRDLPGYELRDRIGSGMFGDVYRAYQASVGREVAVKVIKPELANDPTFVRRFEVEAQLVARLEHPHIVPLYDYWREPNGAFLVMQWLRGGSLSDLLARGPLESKKALRILQQVGGALEAAHRNGIVHQDVKSTNVLLDEDGNGYLTDFGIARGLGENAPITRAADVAAFGSLISEMLNGNAPAEITGVVERATSIDPATAFSSVGETVAALETALGTQTESALSVFTQTRNPYKGLAAFTEADALDFHGRETSVAQVLNAVAESRLVAVVGPSGIGKSSVVRAGLIPALRRGELSESSDWFITHMMPGRFPFEELGTALLRIATDSAADLHEDLSRDERGMARAIKRILPPDAKLLLIIDQFEELFTLTDDATREVFLGALTELLTDDRMDARVVVTIRADYFDRPLGHPELGELLRAGTVPIGAPTKKELLAMVAGPAAGVGVAFAPGLADQIVSDVADQPGGLPLLEYALTELFEARSANVIATATYEDSGGVLAALGRRAESTHEALAVADQGVARQVFLRLVTVDESGRHTRRRVRRSELEGLEGNTESLDAVLAAFGEHRLLTFDRDLVTRGRTIEVAHEALFSEWHRLNSWIDEQREDLLLRRRLADEVQEWEEAGRADDYLLEGGRLSQHEAWASDTDLSLTSSEQDLLTASRRSQDEIRARRSRRRRGILAGFAGAAVVALVLAGVAFINQQRAQDAEGLALSRELAASAINVLDEDPELSLLLTLEAASVLDPPIESVSALHESLAAQRKIFTYSWPMDQGFSDLSAQLSPDGRLLVGSSGGTYIEVLDLESGERLWSHDFAGNGSVRATFNQDGSRVVATYGWSSQVTPELDADTQSQLGAHVLDAQTGAQVAHIETGPCGIVTRPEAMAAVGGPTAQFLVAPVATGPDCLYTGTRGSSNELQRPPVALVDLATGERQQLSDQVVPRDLESGLPPVFVSPNARFLLVGEAAGLVSRVIDRTSGQEVAVLEGWPAGIGADGTIAMTLGEGLMTWDLSSGQPLEPLATVGRSFDWAWLSPDGTTVATTGFGSDADVRLFDARTGAEVGQLLTALGSNNQFSFNADGTRLLVNEVFGGTAVVFDFTVAAEIAAVKLCPEFFFVSGNVDVAGETTTVSAVCDLDDPGLEIFVVDSDSYEIRTHIAYEGGIRSNLSPDGLLVATQLSEPRDIVSQIVLRATTDGEVVATMDGLCEWLVDREWGPDCVAFPETPFPDFPWEFAFSPDGGLLAMASQNWDAVVVWDTETGKIVATPTVQHNTDATSLGFGVAFSPDGSRLAASSIPTPKELWMLSTDDWVPIAQYQVPAAAETNEAPSKNLLFTPDGEILIGTDFAPVGEGRIVFMDGTTLEYLDQISDAHVGVTDLALNAEGTLLASAGLDGVVRVWDVETRTLVHQIPVSGAAGGVAFMQNGKHLSVSSNTDGELRLVTIDTDELIDIARSRVTRTFTETECTTYRIDPCPTLEDIRAG